MMEHISCAKGHGFVVNLDEKLFHMEVLVTVLFQPASIHALIIFVLS